MTSLLAAARTCRIFYNHAKAASGLQESFIICHCLQRQPSRPKFESCLIQAFCDVKWTAGIFESVRGKLFGSPKRLHNHSQTLLVKLQQNGER